MRRERLRAKMMASVQIDPVTGCWLWTGPTSGKPEKGKTGRGYGRVTIDGGTMAAHIVMWVIEHGPIPPRKHLDHVCRQRLCINPAPDHRELVTHKENMRRRDQANRIAKLKEITGATGRVPVVCEALQMETTK